ncbi:MAG: YjbQ family protein [Planctomycetes bacterium]|nr:YjbQ family protein [Planctomycetota bacterium]
MTTAIQKHLLRLVPVITREQCPLLVTSLSIPIRNGQLCLGTWQGIYLCEHRNRGGRRRLVATLWGE